jgi:hypothetical protein
VSDQLWSVGLPFPCLVPWRQMAFTVAEAPFLSAEGGQSQLRALDGLSASMLARVQRVANRHRTQLTLPTPSTSHTPVPRARVSRHEAGC